MNENEMITEFYTSFMRLARLSFENEDYDLAMQAYEMCIPHNKREKNFSANYGMGLSLYYVSWENMNTNQILQDIFVAK